jgi:hypothetical protein
VERPLPLYCEVKLMLNLVSLGYRADDVYGRIVDVREDKGRWLCGIEFTSVSRQSSEKIRLFVQMLIPSYVPVPAGRAANPQGSPQSGSGGSPQSGSAQEAAVGDVDHGPVEDRRSVQG